MSRSRTPSYKALYRDVWPCTPPMNGYPGAFPLGLIKKMKRQGWWGDHRLWLFAGSYKDRGGTTVDINPVVKPDVVADCEHLPFPDDEFDFVMLDPPYSALESQELYGLPYCNIPKVVNEAARVCAPGGIVAMLHRLIPWGGPWENAHKKRLNPIAVVGVYTISNYTNMRALSVWRKMENMERWE